MVLEDWAALEIMSDLFANNTRLGNVVWLSSGIVSICKAVQIDCDLVNIFKGLCRAVVRD